MYIAYLLSHTILPPVMCCYDAIKETLTQQHHTIIISAISILKSIVSYYIVHL